MSDDSKDSGYGLVKAAVICAAWLAAGGVLLALIVVAVQWFIKK